MLALRALAENPRIIARSVAERPGPTVIVVAAIHGNEPAGLDACRRVAANVDLECGAFIALVGNTRALAARVRYVDGDLNRRFRRDTVARIRHGEFTPCDSEDLDQVDFIDVYDRIRQTAHPDHPVILLDLHTFSAHGTPFAMAGDTPLGLEIARASGLPTLLQLETHLPGTMVELGVNDGVPVLAMEGGQHNDPTSANVLADAMHRILASLGMTRVAAPAPPVHADAAPLLLDITYRHAITAADAFRMRPGYRNLSPIGLFEHVADDRHGPVRTPSAGWIVMPLYQGQGSDGFFIATTHPLPR